MSDFNFWWFSPEHTAEILKKGANAGEGARLRVWPKGTKDGGMALQIDFTGSNTAAGDNLHCDPCDPTNDSHVCPPWC